MEAGSIEEIEQHVNHKGTERTVKNGIRIKERTVENEIEYYGYSLGDNRSVQNKNEITFQIFF